MDLFCGAAQTNRYISPLLSEVQSLSREWLQLSSENKGYLPVPYRTVYLFGGLKFVYFPSRHGRQSSGVVCGKHVGVTPALAGTYLVYRSQADKKLRSVI